MEYLDIVDENGKPTGKTVSREEAHAKGIMHRTAHVWIVRPTGDGYEVLLQKRSEKKESYPGMYDTSSAGHITAGDEPLESALRELKEELGIDASPDQLSFAGTFRIRYEKEFHGRMFRDNEIAFVYILRREVDEKTLKLQTEEVEAVEWFDLEETYHACLSHDQKFCVPVPGLRVLMTHLGICPERA